MDHTILHACTLFMYEVHAYFSDQLNRRFLKNKRHAVFQRVLIDDYY